MTGRLGWKGPGALGTPCSLLWGVAGEELTGTGVKTCPPQCIAATCEAEQGGRSHSDHFSLTWKGGVGPGHLVLEPHRQDLGPVTCLLREQPAMSTLSGTRGLVARGTCP